MTKGHAAIRDQLVLVEQIRMLDRPARQTAATLVLGALFLAIALWGKVSETILLAWCAAIGVVEVARLVLSHAFRKANPLPEAISIWRWRHFLHTCSVSVLWGLGGLLLYPEQDIPGQALLTMLLVGLAAGSMTQSTAYLPGNYVFVIVTLIPLIIRTALQWDTLHLITATLLTVYLGFVLNSSWIISHMLINSLRMRYENLDLIEELRLEKRSAEAARQEAETANRAKSRFLAAASHDLRQPLHALGLFAAALNEKIRYPEARVIVDNINKSVDALETLFSELLDISKLDAGVILPSLSSFPLQQLFDRILNDYGPEAAERGLFLKVPPTRVVVYSDPTLLERIVRNLVANAIRYTARGGILVGVRRRQEKVVIEVWDSGIGIPAHEQENVFQEFYQVGNQERDRNKGLGLGLAIVRRLARLLNHDLDLKSKSGKGSVFRIEVPVGKLAELSAIPVGKTADQSDSLRGSFVVVIDDEKSVRDAMRTLLSEWHCAVSIAASVEELLPPANNLTRVPDLIIADYRLRDGATGAQAIRRLQMHYGEHIPAILVTGDTAPDRISEARASGYQLLHKPIPAVRLKILMAYLIGRRNGAVEGNQ